MLQLIDVKEDARKERARLEAEELKNVMQEIVEPFIQKLAEKYKNVAIASRQERAQIDDSAEVLDLSSVKYRSTIEAVQCNIKSPGWHFKAEGDKITISWCVLS